MARYEVRSGGGAHRHVQSFSDPAEAAQAFVKAFAEDPTARWLIGAAVPLTKRREAREEMFVALHETRK